MMNCYGTKPSRLYKNKPNRVNRDLVQYTYLGKTWVIVTLAVMVDCRTTCKQSTHSACRQYW